MLARPGFSRTVTPALSAELAQRQLANPRELHDRPHGSIVVMDNPEVDISATALRGLLQAGSPEAARWLPPAVAQFIEKHRLYQANNE